MRHGLVPGLPTNQHCEENGAINLFPRMIKITIGSDDSYGFYSIEKLYSIDE